MLSAELTQRWISKLSDALYRVVNVPNFSIVLAPDQSGRLNLLDSTSGKINKRFWFDFGLQILDGPTERLSEIALSEHGELLALSGTTWNKIAILNVLRLVSLDDTMALRVTSSNEIWGHKMVLTDGGGKPSPAFTGGLAFRFAEYRRESFTNIAFCDSDTRVVAVTNRGRLIGWDTTSMVAARQRSLTTAEVPLDLEQMDRLYVREVIPSRFGRREVRGVACNNKGRLVLIGDEGRDGFLQLWNSREGELIDSVHVGSPAAHSTRVQRVTFDGSGVFFLTVGEIEDQIWRIVDDSIVPIARVITRKYPRLFPTSHFASLWPPGGFIVSDGEGTFVIDPLAMTAKPVGAVSKEPIVCGFKPERGFEC